jgi:hypothetical protein
MKPRAQTVALAAIGIADLISTLFFVGMADAAEANPFMARFLEKGPVVFIQAKLFLLLIPLIIIERARRKKPEFVRRAVNTAIVAYVGLYSAGFVHLNNRPPIGSVVLPSTTQDQLDAKRKEMGLPPAPPLQILASSADRPPRSPMYVPLVMSRLPAAPKRAKIGAIAPVNRALAATPFAESAEPDSQPASANRGPLGPAVSEGLVKAAALVTGLSPIRDAETPAFQ